MGGKDDISCYEVLYSNTPLSFWGGICPTTGNVIDHSHPLYNSNVKNKVLWYVAYEYSIIKMSVYHNS